jgi:hypothetical protein
MFTGSSYCRLTLHAVIACTVVLFLSAGSGSSCGQGIVPYPNLPAGSPYYLTFVTADATNGEATDDSYYSSFVQSEATMPGALAPGVLQWQAMVNVSAGGISLGLNPFAPVYSINAQQLVVSRAGDLFATGEALTNPIDLNQYGETGDLNRQVWTGSTAYTDSTVMWSDSGVSPPTYTATYSDMGEYTATTYSFTSGGSLYEYNIVFGPSIGILDAATPSWFQCTYTNNGNGAVEYGGEQPEVSLKPIPQMAAGLLADAGSVYAISNLLSVPNNIHLPGEVIADGKVDINDLTIVLTNFGQTGVAWSQGSIDGDPTGTVDINDLTLVLANFGTTYGASSEVGAVPEPSCLALLGISALSLLAFARRTRRGS